MTYLTVMILMRLLTPNSYHFQIHDPVKVRVAEVVLASDPFNADHNPGLSVACRAMVVGQNWHFQSTLFGENPLVGGI